MSTRSTLILGVVLLALVSLFLFGKKPTDEPGAKPRVFSFEADDVQSLTIDRAIGARGGASPSPSASSSASASPAAAGGPRTREKLVFEKQHDQWVMTSPLHALANGSDLSTFLSTLTSLRPTETVEKTDPAFGLSDPDAVFELKTKDGTHKLTLGTTTVTDQGYYATADTQPGVLITGQGLAPMLNKSADLWRDKNPIAIDVEKVTRWSLVRDGQTLTVEKDKDGHWQITQPVAMRADEQQATSVLMQMKNVQVKDFPADVKPDDPRLKATATLSVWTSDSGTTPSTLTIGSQDPKTHDWYAVRSPLGEVMLIPDKNMAPLHKTAQDLEDKHVVAFEMNDIDQVHLTAGPDDVEAKKDGFDWTLTKPAGGKDDLHKVSNALDHIHSLLWTKKMTGKDASGDLGFDKPALVAVLFKGKDTVATVQFGKTTAGHGVLVRVLEHPDSVYEVSDTSLAFLKNVADSLATPVKPTPSAAPASPSAGPASPSAAPASPSGQPAPSTTPASTHK